MIFNGRNGYVKGDLSQPNGTILGMTRGNIKSRNWFATLTNPKYSITITAGATGTVAFQGTNDIAYYSDTDDRNPVMQDILPSMSATWTDIQAATSSSASGSWSTEYEFIRLVIVASGTGIVTQMWTKWS